MATSLITVKQAASILGCTTSSIRRLIKSRKLKGVRHKGEYNQHGFIFLVERTSVTQFAKQPQATGYPRGRKRQKPSTVENPNE